MNLSGVKMRFFRGFKTLLFVGGTFLAFLLVSVSAVSGTQSEQTFAPLITKLIHDGLRPSFVRSLYRRGVHPQYSTVSKYMRIRESRLNYDQFLKPAMLRAAKRFMREHQAVLCQVEKYYGVDSSVITGILLVESKLGQYTGRTPVFATLSTFALMDHSLHRNQIWKRLRPEDRKRWGRKRFDAKLKSRAQWAYGELRALLLWANNDPQKILPLRGSLMGAIGWPQFLPSSILNYGVDGNGNGQIDLFTPEDAIFSVANYLRSFGWQQNGNLNILKKALYHYNHSTPYVETVLELVRRLKQCEQTSSG